MSKLLNRKTAVAALAVTAVLGGGVAFAYPPGTALTVAATASPAPGNQMSVMVTVGNANPTCATRVNINGGSDVLLPAGTTTTTVVVASKEGRNRVRARTVDCTKGNKEHAKNEFVVGDGKAAGAPSSPVGKNYVVEITGVEPGSSVSSTATLTGSDPLIQLNDADAVDRRGEATVKFKLKQSGNWVVTTTVTPSGQVLNPVNVSVP